MFCGGNKTLMSNITAPWWSELPRGWKEVFCNTEETKLKFSCVTLKNKISACKVALWITCEKTLHLGSRASLAINGELASRLLSGGQLTTVRGLLASSPVADDHLLAAIRVNSFPSYPSRASRLSPALALLACSVHPTEPLGKPVEEADALPRAHHRTITLLLCLESLSFTTVSNCEGRAQIEWSTRERPRTTEQHQGHSTV